MLSPRNPHQPTALKAHYKKSHIRWKFDDWLPFLAALGLLGGSLGWLLLGGFPAISLRASRPTVITGQPTTAAGGAIAPEIHGAGQLPERGPDAIPSDHGVGLLPVPGRSQNQASNEVTVPKPQQPDSLAIALSELRPPLVFTDVSATAWYKPFIDALTARGILNGLPDGSFAPDRPMTRAELAVQLSHAFDIAPSATPKAFTDVPPNFWASATINEAVTTGFMTGYPARDFRPNQTVSRLEVLLALASGLSLPAPTAPEMVLQQYQDLPAIPGWAKAQVAAVAQAGIISASPNTDYRLRPSDPATRAEVAALIYSTLAYMGKVDAVEKLLAPQ